MTNRNTIHNFLATVCVVAAIALTGCGASPTAAKRPSAKSKVATMTTPALQPALQPQLGANQLTNTVAAQPKTVAAKPVVTAPVEVIETPVEVAPEEITEVPTPPELGEELMGILNTPALTAEVVAQKNGSFLGMGTFKCTVAVRNDGETPRKGLLRLTFKNGTKDSGSPGALKLVTLAPGETQTFDFEDKKWTTDGAEATISATMPNQSLAAYVVSKKNGVFLGAGTFKCTVDVINPDEVARTGTLVVVFRNGKKDAKTEAIRQSVTLAPHQTLSFEFENKKWTTDNAAVTVE